MKGIPNLKLKAQMVIMGKTQRDLCTDLGFNITTFNRKLLGLRGEFSESEIKSISEYLKVNPTEIFFNSEVANCTTKSA